MRRLDGLDADITEVLLVPITTSTPKAVFTLRDIRQVDKICRQMEDADGVVLLEDADFALLNDRFQKFDNWNPSKPDVRRLVMRAAEVLENAQAVDAKELKSIAGGKA